MTIPRIDQRHDQRKDLIPKKKLLDIAGWKARNSLDLWADLHPDLRPVMVGPHPGGSGRTNLYVPSAIQLVTEIRSLQSQGLSRAEIFERFRAKKSRSRSGPVVNQQPAGPTRFIDVDQLPEGDPVPVPSDENALVARAVASALRNLALVGMQEHVLLAKLIQIKCLDRAVAILNRGFNPVLFYTETDADVIEDVMVSVLLSDPAVTQRPAVVFPLLPILEAILVRDPDLRSRVQVIPALKLWRREQDALVEHPFVRGGGHRLNIITRAATTGAAAEPPVALEDDKPHPVDLRKIITEK